MNKSNQLTLDDKIKNAPPIEHWHDFLRNYPSALKDIMELIPKAQDLDQARLRTTAIWSWMHQCRTELCTMIMDVNNPGSDQLMGVEFGDSPYGTHKPPSGMNRRYFDPLFPAPPPDASFMSFDGPRLGRDEELVPGMWDASVIEAEHAWFAKITAPVACLLVVIPGKPDPIMWDASSKIISLPPSQRHLGGWYPKGFPQDLVDEDTPLEVLKHPKVKIDLFVYQPSERLVAQRAREFLVAQLPKFPNAKMSDMRKF